MGLILRRTLAVLLGIVLLVIFGGVAIAGRLAAAVFDPAFATGELRKVDAYRFTYDALLPATLEHALGDQPAVLPENLGAIELPSDPASRQAMVDFIRTAIPPEFAQQQTEQALAQFVPYLAGRSDDFAIRLSLHDRLLAAFGHPPGQPSAAERLFRQLGMGRRVVDGALAHLSETGAPPAVQVADHDAAGEWLTTQLFGALDQLVPYLTGDRPSFRVQISFAEQPGLAEPLAPMLTRSPEQLRSEGFTYDDRDLNLALAGDDPAAQAAAAREIDQRLTAFRADRVITAEDLPQRDPGSSDGFDLERARALARTVRRIVDWGGPLAILALAALAGLLGGRRWPGRAVWAASTLLAASVWWWLVSGPLYRLLASPRLHDALDRRAADWPAAYQPLRPAAVSKIMTVIDDLVGGIATRSLLWMACALIALGAALVWGAVTRPGGPPPWWTGLRARLRRDGATGTATTTLPPPTLPPPTA